MKNRKSYTPYNTHDFLVSQCPNNVTCQDDLHIRHQVIDEQLVMREIAKAQQEYDEIKKVKELDPEVLKMKQRLFELNLKFGLKQ